MNSVTKLIYITMAITWWQFSLVQTDDTSALELCGDSKHLLFRYEADQHKKGILSNRSLKFLYFCPSQEEWHTKFDNQMARNSLFLVEISDVRKTVPCKNKVVPFLTTDDQKKCGINNTGILHFLRHQLVYPTNFIEKMGWKSIDMTQYEQLGTNTMTDERMMYPGYADQFLIFINIYQFCFYHDSHETAFASYIINSSDSKQPQIPQNFDTRLTENDDQLFGLDDAPLCYKKENQTFGPDLGSKIGDDYLVEQMLVPWGDIVENVERGTTKNYVNVSPQWKSLREDWSSLNRYFKTLPIRLIVCGTYGKFEHIHLSKTRADKEQQQEIPPDQLHDSNAFKKPNLTLTVPRYWWKLVIFSDGKAIVVIMPNYPKNVIFPSDTIEKLCEDVCDKYKWTDVKKINPSITCCEPGTDLVAKLLSVNAADIPEDILSLAPASNPSASVLNQLWNSFTGRFVWLTNA